MHDELKDGIDNYDGEQAKKFAPFKSNRFDILNDLNNTKKKVEKEMEEYKQKFSVPEQEVKLQPFEYP